MPSRDAVIECFRAQARWAAALGSPFMVALMERAAAALAADGVLPRLIGDWPGDPGADGLALRFAGALHALVLAGADRDLAALYPPQPLDVDRLWRAAEAAMAARPEHFAAFLAQPPQTNEVGRSALLLPGFVAIAQATQRPLRLLEIGASAGLNLLWDCYRYDYGERQWGDPASSVAMTCEWRGAALDLGVPLQIVSRAACDRAPIGIADPAQRARLRAYIWPDQRERLARLDAALALAVANHVRVDEADAADWVEAKLATPAPDAATVLYHSVVWQYLPAQTRDRIRAALDAAGAKATPQAPLAWLSLEILNAKSYELRLTLWPGDGGKRRLLLARTHPHGAWLEWLGDRGATGS